MVLSVDGYSVGYDRADNGGKPLLILHGWGCDAKVMRRVFFYFADKGRDVIAIDFPGFGRSPSPPATFTIYDYAAITARFLEILGVREPDVIAHSFGGRVAIILAAHSLTSRVLITDGAGVRPKRGLKYYIKVAAYKLKKKIGIEPKNAGSADYRALDDDMKRVFVNVVNAHLDCLLPDINRSVLLVWGEKDRDTPLYMANKINAKVKDSAVVVMKNCGHFAFAENFPEFIAIADSFLS